MMRGIRGWEPCLRQACEVAGMTTVDYCDNDEVNARYLLFFKLERLEG